MLTSDSYQASLIESLKDPEAAAAYLEATLEEGEPELLKLALKNVVQAQVEKSKIGANSLSLEKLERMFLEEKFEVYRLGLLLNTLRFKLAITLK